MSKQNQEEFEPYLRVWDTKEFINSWSNIVEEAVLDAGQVHDPNERKNTRAMEKLILKRNKSPDQGFVTNIRTIWNSKLNSIIWKEMD